ncbi:MAG: adenylate/guanylate cyclase domain-containing protein [Rhodospirillaceae bacterium]
MAAPKIVYKTSFVLYCRASGGDWVEKGEWQEAQEQDALATAHASDDESQWQTVRLINVRTYPDGRAPQETIAWMTGIPKGAERNGMITEAIFAIGTKKKMAGPFCEKFEEDEKDSKSKSMIDAGRSAMQQFIDGDAQAFGQLRSILEAFTSNKAAKASAQGVVIVMFTDLVGSTKMTEELGDLGAQQVVRTHNAIVRNALPAYHGREVKHTGDGIMAVYYNAANAVASTMVMQQEFAKKNSIPSNPPVRVRIGLNAGQAVEEENDYFGTTVQLSARVCDKANADQIFVTQSARDLSTGHSIQFKPAGDFAMKGIFQPVPVFEVAWNAQMQAAG